MHFQAILAHFILLLGCNSFTALASPAIDVNDEDIFSKLNPCMVTVVLVSISLRPDVLWKANTILQPHWLSFVFFFKQCNPRIEKCVHCDVDSTGQITRYCVRLDIPEGTLCNIKKRPGCKCGPGIYQQYDEPWISPIRVLMDPTLNPSCYTDAVRRTAAYPQLFLSFSCLSWNHSYNLFWVYRTANLETWANHAHRANFQ